MISAHTNSPVTAGRLANASQVDALTLEAQNLHQEITQAKLIHQQREKVQEVLELWYELALLQCHQLDQKAVRTHLVDQDKKTHASSLVVADLRKMASSMKKVDKK